MMPLIGVYWNRYRPPQRETFTVGSGPPLVPDQILAAPKRVQSLTPFF